MTKSPRRSRERYSITRTRTRIQQPAPFHYHYIHDCAYNHVRVWKTINPGDMFDCIPIDRFQSAFEALRLEHDPHWVKGFPTLDDGTLSCRLCKLENGELEVGRIPDAEFEE